MSIDSNGRQGSGPSRSAAVSADGRFVAFSSFAFDLVSGDTNVKWDVFVHDRATGITSRVSVDSSGMQANADSHRPCISADGRFVTFHSSASNLVARDTNGYSDVFVRDRVTGATSRVSIAWGGHQSNGESRYASISADGRFVAFESNARNMTNPHSQSSNSIFVHDRLLGETSLISATPDGVRTAGTRPSISGDGRFVAFDTQGVAPFSSHVYLHDRDTSATVRVSVSTAGLQGNGPSYNPSISGDGRSIAFESRASNLVDEDTNGRVDVFVRDQASGTTTRVSVDSTGTQGNHESFAASISTDGRFVAFQSYASNLVPRPTSRFRDVFVHDRLFGITVYASVNRDGVAGEFESHSPSISRDGRSVAFTSASSNLVPDGAGREEAIFVRELTCLAIRGVVPVTGSEEGNDLAWVLGSSFTDFPITEVTFGDRAAEIVDLRPSRIAVRTPPGTGVVDVTLRGWRGSAGLATGYRYVERDVAARYGSVIVGIGDREDVLFLNASAGDPLNRETCLRSDEPIAIVVVPPSSLSQARFALYGWIRAPNASTFTPLPRGLGAMALAPPLAGGSPPVVWNNAGFRRALGAPTLPSRPAPWVLFRTAGSPAPITFTLQGFIEDQGSRVPEGWSVTNALVVRVR